MILRGFLSLALALVLATAATQARAQRRAAPELHVVVLASVATMAQRPATALPAAFRRNSLYWRVVKSGGKTTYQLCLGFFDTRTRAERARGQLARSFRGARVIKVSSKEREDLQKAKRAAEAPPSAARPPPSPRIAAVPVPSAAPPRPAPPSVPRSAMPPAPAGDAEALMAEGRAAITREDYDAAISAFTRLRALAENSLTRDAHEFLAYSYERRGNTARARREYENYLKRYPDGADSVRVRQRLANLSAAPQRVALRAPVQRQRGWRSFTSGSVSQFYYRGNSTIDTQQTQVVANTLDRTTLSLTDQSALISTLDLSARFLDDTHDNRVVFRDMDTRNFISGQRSINRLNAAYYDYKYKPGDVSARLGRQPGNSGGLLGRFDGALFGYGLMPGLRLNLVGGSPVEQSFDIDSTRRFWGVSSDIGPLAERWTGSLYTLRQTVDGIADREAAGIEARYFTPQGYFASMVDYDTLFRHVNIATMQGNWIAPWKTSYNVLLDYRMTPTLQTSTAVIGETSTSIRTLLETYSEDELRQRARALTARSAFASAGFTHPVTREWQFGADFRASRVSHTDGTNIIPAIPGTGYVYTLTGQAIGTSIFATRDVTVVALSRVSAPTYTGSAARLNSRVPLGADWSLDGSAFWYGQTNEDGSRLQRISPTLRLSYRWGNNVSFEAELGAESGKAKSATSEETTRRSFFSLGYRWDF
ncbi:MAG: tetratricopeptide repeat protein [Burkholderiales bacterium]